MNALTMEEKFELMARLQDLDEKLQEAVAEVREIVGAWGDRNAEAYLVRGLEDHVGEGVNPYDLTIQRLLERWEEETLDHTGQDEEEPEDAYSDSEREPKED